MQPDDIIIQGARQHNLKNIHVTIPRNKLTVITGLSGSGKSSLAFDTLYAEGQRRYVESLSSYARQFLGQMEKPDVDLIQGLSPAIAIEQKTGAHNPRSTVGTITEIYDYLRLMFARIGEPFCYQCNRPISAQTIDQMMDQLMALPEKTKIIILSPLITQQKGAHDALFKQLKRDGFARVKIDGNFINLDDPVQLNKNQKHTIQLVIDRLIIKDDIKNRLADSLELALKKSNGIALVEIPDEKTILFNEKFTCAECQISYPEFTPASFSFNSPQGACTACGGLGSTTDIDPNLVVPNKELSLRDGAVLPWANRDSVYFSEFLDALTSYYRVNIYTPYKDLSEHFKKVLLFGSGTEEIPLYIETNDDKRIRYKKSFEGVIPNLKRRYLETESQQMREEIKQFMNFHPCEECHGSRLNPFSRSVKVGELTISQITELTIDKAIHYIQSLELTGKKRDIGKPIIKEIMDRLSFLENVGLSYLTLNRSASSLSGGESQRIRLATQIGSKLTGVLYVLDEPSIGLHQRDNARLLATLQHMRDLGNTVLVVEHDTETIMASDYVIDMGPGAGIHGGEVVFSGPPDGLLNDPNSLTGAYISGKKEIEIPQTRRSSDKKLILKGASANNLKSIDVEFPLGCLICVTCVSGSGKSTLILETLYRILSRHFYHSKISSGAYRDILGLEYLDKVLHIDQSPIGRTPRSNPGTYTGIFSHIRELFSKSPEARLRGYTPGRFSFNVNGGRCGACTGDGIIKIEMHFLPDVYVNCDVCQGKRYNRETLEIKYKGKNISEVLEMTINQAVVFFENIPQIKNKLITLIDVGLGYIQLGQSATTLSGGEAQRLKLSRELSKKGTGRTIYILDEPTTGLHTEDIKKLLRVLNELVNARNTVIIIEHNLDVIKYADHIIDLGPEGGDEGGRIIACGTPETIAEHKDSYTGIWLKNYLLK
ncbi:MAG: excinuclease ABC subunit UvrA [Desulfobacterales bacterium]|nr:excinuclease ABC subunit UvrA [Desulfobacterales bacterium]